MRKQTKNGLGTILTIYIALKPLYLNASGSLQIADIFMVLGLIYVLLSARGRVRLPTGAKPFLKILWTFTLFVCVINGLWSLTGYSYIKPILYYGFNFLAVILCLCIYRKVGKQNYEQAICNGLFLSAIVALLGLVMDGQHKRATGFFNNPNQLGYYGIIIVSFVLLFKKNRWSFKEVFVFVAGVVCVTLSLSKAAFVGLLFQCILSVIFIGNKKSRKTIIKQLVLIVLVGMILYLFLFTDIFTGILSNSGFQSLIRMRDHLMAAMGESDSKLGSGRGYDRIKELGVHFLWGMGEGNYSRFVSLRGLEVHSTYASIIVSYGVIGFLLFIAVLLKAIWRNNQFCRNFTILSGSLIYALTHNGIRNTLLWILIVSIYFFGRENQTGLTTETDKQNMDKSVYVKYE